MQLRCFSIPAHGDAAAEGEVNRFLRSSRALNVRREFVAAGGDSFWAVMVEYLDAGQGAVAGSGPGGERTASGKTRIDYREILSPADFAVFVKLREWRRRTSEAEAVPVYTVLTNEQLAKLAVSRPDSVAKLKEVEGLGESKAAKYGAAVLAIVAQAGDPSAAPSGAPV